MHFLLTQYFIEYALAKIAQAVSWLHNCSANNLSTNLTLNLKVKVDVLDYPPEAPPWLGSVHHEPLTERVPRNGEDFYLSIFTSDTSVKLL